ncbi:MAG: hypothetical protein AAF733_00225 [Verrucomicrobiota bacterium]
MKSLSLVAATFAFLYGALDLTMDSRGAIDFARPFHAWCALATSVLIVLTLNFSRKWIGSQPLALSLSYVLFVLLIWGIALPIGDWAAIEFEKREKTAQQVAESGYGWYYFDDSGRGNRPMSLLRVVLHLFSVPQWPAMFFLFAFSYFRAVENSARKKNGHSGGSGTPLD